jgi:glycosyltransferase involved in cell wall biosynthesis
MTTPSQPKLRVLVMMPAHNEEGRIGPVVHEVRRVMPDADIAVVNDDSTDETAQQALTAGATVLPHAVNLGYGAGLETGYCYALQQGYDVVLQMDSDGQHPPAELSRLCAPLAAGTADIVIGSRYMEGSAPCPVSPVRRLGQRFFALILLALTRRRFTDPTSGFQALNRQAIRFFASGVFPCDYPDADVLLMAHLAGFRILEIPVRMEARSGGTSMHSGLKPVYYGMKMLLSLFVVLLNVGVWRRWRKKHAA